MKYDLTTADLVTRIGLERKAIRRRAKALGLGINLEGRAGYRYSEADYERLVESLRPKAETKRQQKRGRRGRAA